MLRSRLNSPATCCRLGIDVSKGFMVYEATYKSKGTLQEHVDIDVDVAGFFF